MKKLMLVDGNSMLFRAYYATAYGHQMTTSHGIPSNAVYGFAMMMQKALETVQPDMVLVAFDAGKHTFRHDLYPQYKGTRKPAPDDLVPQFAMVRDYLDGFHIRWTEQMDIEADDLIGTLSASAGQYHTVILSSDHDLLQLIDSSTDVLLMKKGITEMETMTQQKLKEEMGIIPSQIIDMKGLMGDASDNIPGIPGVGEKTALKLLAQYPTVEDVLANADSIKGVLGTKIKNNRDSALLSKQLATIKRDVKLDFTAEDCAFRPDYKDLIQFFESVDMNTLMKRYQGMLNTETLPIEEKAAASSEKQQVHVCPVEMLQKDCAIAIEQTDDSYMTASAYGIALYDGQNCVYINKEDALNDQALLQYLKDRKHMHIGYDIKRMMHMSEKLGIEIIWQMDAMICASLVDSSLNSKESIISRFDLDSSIRYEDVYGKGGRMMMAEPEMQIKHACMQAENTMHLYRKTIDAIKEMNMHNLLIDIEIPLSAVLYKMEKQGIIADASILDAISKQTLQKMQIEQDEIYAMTKHPFNINSPKQLAEVLYDELQLPSGKKRSTAADVLEKLDGIHPIIEHLLRFRKYQKLYSTYAEGLKKYIAADGRIHTIYNQCATSTGRLSSSEPNLQNISVRDEEGKEIRKAFLPSSGCVLISSDYSQIELRMLAHMADEQGLIEAFRSGMDIHTKTAMDIFSVSKDEVTSLMRRQAKTVNFGIVYGISDFGLAEQLHISRAQAHEFIETYYMKYPRIRIYMNSIIDFCEKNGYVTTLLGRRREIPQIHDKNHMIREFGKRAAMNAPIQGSAADLIKIAMIHIDEDMQKAGVRSKMILQVHDELIFDVFKEEIDTMKQLIQNGMEHAMELKVPLKAETEIGTDWYEAK